MRTTTKKKLLLLLTSGLGLSLARTPKQYFRIIKETHRAYKEIDRRKLFRLISEFRHDRLVKCKNNPDGTISIVLTEDGQKKALRYNIDDIKIKTPSKWDKKWRLVIFDIPEKKKHAREVLRSKLKELGFHQFQKSCFIYPYECENEINFVVELFELRLCVTLIKAEKITNEAALKLKFKLS